MTEVALKEYLERRLEELDRRVEQRFVLVDHALNKVEHALTLRLEAMNEVRESLKDQASRMATRVETDKIDEAVRELQRAKANLDGRFIALAGGVSLMTSGLVSILIWALARAGL